MSYNLRLLISCPDRKGLISQVEQAGRSEEPGHAWPLIPLLEEEFGRVRAVLERELSRH